MIRHAMTLAMVACAAGASTLDTAALLDGGIQKKLLEEKNPIRAETSGIVPVPYGQALAVFSQSNLLACVQREYCELLAENGTPEFTINQTSTNTYFYINANGERTDITEVLRHPSPDGSFNIVLYSVGERFFGRYEALIHVQLTDAGPDGTRYAAVVYAYPENAVSRFFARHLGLVDRYFSKKTGQMAEIVKAIGCSLCRKAA